MALKIWMPFISDTENQGLCTSATLQKTAGTYTANASGKLGGCYSGSGLYHAPAEFLGNQWSVAVWVSANSFGQYNNIIFCKNLAASTDCQIYWSIISNNTYNIGVNGPSGTTTYSYTFSTNTWYHLATTYDGARIKMYINGALVKDVAYASTQPSGRLNFGLGARSGNEAGTSLQAAGDWKYNDFRLYDTVISDKEVEELARGLVLHYKLDGGIMRGENLIANSALGNTWTYPSSSYSDKYSPVTLSIPAGDVYTLSFDAKSTVAGDIIRTHYYSPNTTTTCVSSQGTTRTAGDGYMTFRLSTTWERYWVTYYQSQTTAVKHIICPRLVSGEGSGSVSVRHVKFEEGTMATAWSPAPTDSEYDATYVNRVCDCSGYKRHGVATNLSTATSAPRYTVCAQLPQSASSILIGNFSTMVPEGNFTFNIWFKKVTDEWSTKGYETIFGGPSGFELEAKSSTTNSPKLVAYNWGGTICDYTLDTWHMVTMTRTASATQFYLDGVLKMTGSAGTIPSNNYYIGSWRDANSQNFRGYMSDARIYATVLTAKQILELYNESAAIDRAGTYFTRELIEQ